MNLQFYRDSVSHHGLGPTLYHAAYRAANHVTEIAVWDALVLTMDKLDKRYLDAGKKHVGRMLDAGAMRPYVIEPENMLTHAFIDAAIENGDRCYALFDGDTLMSYGWYSTLPTRLTEIPGAPTLYFDPSYAYMYNGYTLPAYRGLRLHGIGMAAALEVCTNEGLEGLVSYVASENFASLKSCYRMGYECFGHLCMLKVGARHLWRATPGCKKYGFHVEPTVS